MCAIFRVCASLNLLGDYRQISVILIFLSSDVICCSWNRNIWVPLFLFMPSRVGYQSLPASRFIWRARRATQLAYQNDLFKDNIQQTFILVEMMVQRTPWYFVYFTLKFWFILLLNLQSSGIKKKIETTRKCQKCSNTNSHLRLASKAWHSQRESMLFFNHKITWLQPGTKTFSIFRIFPS